MKLAMAMLGGILAVFTTLLFMLVAGVTIYGLGWLSIFPLGAGVFFIYAIFDDLGGFEND